MGQQKTPVIYKNEAVLAGMAVVARQNGGSICLLTVRNSGTADRICCRGMGIFCRPGDFVMVSGSIKSDENGKLFVAVRHAKRLYGSAEFKNRIIISGSLKEKGGVKFFGGGRQMLEFWVDIREKETGMSVPCVAWGKNAQRLCEIPAGRRLALRGRLMMERHDDRPKVHAFCLDWTGRQRAAGYMADKEIWC